MIAKYSFPPGRYYIGDPGFVLHSDDLRVVFTQLILVNQFEPGAKESSHILKTKSYVEPDDRFWITKTPSNQGTYYDQEGRGYGFDWGIFGVVPEKLVELKDQYSNNVFEFTEWFDCYIENEKVVVGNKVFSTQQ